MEITPHLLINLGLWYFVFLFSTVFHEFAHALTGYFFGDHTAKENGLMTLDPTPHIKRTPFGLIGLPIISFFVFGFTIGYASVPINAHFSIKKPKASGLVSLAGPLSNLILALLALGILKTGIASGFFEFTPKIQFDQLVTTANPQYFVLAKLVSILFFLNVIYFAFNILPIPPLDGSTAIPILLPKNLGTSYLQILYSNRSLEFFGLFIAWHVFDKFFAFVLPYFLWLF